MLLSTVRQAIVHSYKDVVCATSNSAIGSRPLVGRTDIGHVRTN